MVETTEVAAKKPRGKTATPVGAADPAPVEEKEPEMVTVELTRNGTQVGGVSLPVGAHVDVTAGAAERLVAKKRATLV